MRISILLMIVVFSWGCKSREGGTLSEASRSYASNENYKLIGPAALGDSVGDELVESLKSNFPESQIMSLNPDQCIQSVQLLDPDQVFSQDSFAPIGVQNQTANHDYVINQALILMAPYPCPLDQSGKEIALTDASEVLKFYLFFPKGSEATEDVKFFHMSMEFRTPKFIGTLTRSGKLKSGERVPPVISELCTGTYGSTCDVGIRNDGMIDRISPILQGAP